MYLLRPSCRVPYSVVLMATWVSTLHWLISVTGHTAGDSANDLLLVHKRNSSARQGFPLSSYMCMDSRDPYLVSMFGLRPRLFRDETGPLSYPELD